MTRRLAGLISAACLAIAALPAYAQVIRDDFAAGISTQHWFACRRPENAFKLVREPGGPAQAVEMTVRPRQDLAVFAMVMAHPGCTDTGVPFEPEKDERAELWEADAVRLEVGTEVWYRFSFLVDPGIPVDAGRLVIGQWKQANSATGTSPVIAQRFNGRAFTITIEQDNTAPDHPAENTQCRIWVAVDENAARAAGGSQAHGLSLMAPITPGAPPELPSLGHDERDVSYGATLRPDGSAAPPPCRRDVDVQQLGVLPSPFGRWVSMLYRIRLGGPSGLVEIWADGRPIARVTGRIGFRTSRPGKQYFKFGPYREPQSYATYARLAAYARGFRREDVEP
jgi:hypothetical protein